MKGEDKKESVTQCHGHSLLNCHLQKYLGLTKSRSELKKGPSMSGSKGKMTGEKFLFSQWSVKLNMIKMLVIYKVKKLAKCYIKESKV